MQRNDAREHMTARETVFSRILCAVDGSRSSHAAVTQAVALTGDGADLEFLAVTDVRGIGFNRQATLSPWHAARAVSAARDVAKEAGIAASITVEGADEPAHHILAAADGHDLLVVGISPRSRFGGIALGRTATLALHASPIPVLAARPATEPFPGALMVATVGAADDHAVELAARVGRATGAPLTIAHVRDGHAAVPHRALAKQIVAATEILGVEPPVSVLIGSPHERLPQLAGELGVGLIVLGSRGLTGPAALASVSERVAHAGPASVLVVRSSRERA